MSIIIPANSASAAGGFQVANSVRFNGNSNDHLKRTFGTPTNAQKYTMSWWFKGTGTATGSMFEAASGNAQNGAFVYLKTDDLQINSIVGNSEVMKLIPNAHYQDYCAWYHLCFAVDVTLGTAADRNKLYINGERVTSFVTQTNAPQNTNGMFNTAIEHLIGIDVYNSGGSLATPFNGYISEFVFIDGSQEEVTAFGEFDEDSGIWKPIDVSGLTFGTNGFYLDFENSGALGADVSGNTNNFTVNNLTAIDQSTDTCTNNFATMNPLDNFYYNGVFTEGNLKIINGSGREAGATSTFAISNGKWFWEAKPKSNVAPVIGIQSVPSAANTSSSASMQVNGYGYLKTGKVETSNGSGGSTVLASYATYAADDIIGVAVDLDGNKIYFYKNGALQGSGVTITAASATTNGHYFAGFGVLGGQDTFEVNFGSPPFAISSGNADGNGYGNFEYAVPSGYYALNTKNLAEYG